MCILSVDYHSSIYRPLISCIKIVVRMSWQCTVHLLLLHISGSGLRLAGAAANHVPSQQASTVIHPTQQPLKELAEDGILWGVPKSRRSREKRMTRKFGSESFTKKLLPILPLKTCDRCGHVHERDRLCRKFIITTCIFCTTNAV